MGGFNPPVHTSRPVPENVPVTESQHHVRDIAERAAARGMSVVTAESLTSGQLAAAIGAPRAVRAAGGASRDELRKVADMALRNWQ